MHDKIAHLQRVKESLQDIKDENDQLTQKLFPITGGLGEIKAESKFRRRNKRACNCKEHYYDRSAEEADSD